jgi:hypothetical protein
MNADLSDIPTYEALMNATRPENDRTAPPLPR